MTEVMVTIALASGLLLGIEVLRWKLRPEQRRLRMIRKIGRR